MLLKSPHPFLTDTLSFILQLRLIPSYGFGQLTFEEYLEKNMTFDFSFKDAETTILCKSFNVSKLLR